MKAFTGTFVKSNGDSRTMNFVRLNDLPQQFLDTNTSGGNGPKLSEGQEVVWDLERNAFRVFNWTTTVGDVAEEALSDSTILSK
jgi:hypothetical protein